MKIVTTLFILLTSFLLSAQKEPASRVKNDRFTFKAGFSVGGVNYFTDEIKDYVGFSNESWNYADSFHYADFYHEKTIYWGRTFLLKFGCHIPLYQFNKMSLSIESTLGIGGQKQLSPEYEVSYTVGEEEDLLNSLITDVRGTFVGRYYLDSEKFYALKIGVRRISAVDKYAVPMASISFGYRWFEASLYAHLYKKKYYREFSNGELELAQSIYQFGISLTANFITKK